MSRAFTLIELLVSVSIIAIILAIGIASYATINRQSRDTKRKADVEQIRSALEMYRTDAGSYPGGSSSWQDTKTALQTLVDNNYLPSVPADPLPNGEYWYEPLNQAPNGSYYGYCLCSTLENYFGSSADSNCKASDNSPLPLAGTYGNGGCNYGRANP